MDESRGLAIAMMVLAVALIAVGRRGIRRARRMETGAVGQRRRRRVGWSFVFAGGLLMIVGAVVW